MLLDWSVFCKSRGKQSKKVKFQAPLKAKWWRIVTVLPEFSFGNLEEISGVDYDMQAVD